MLRAAAERSRPDDLEDAFTTVVAMSRMRRRFSESAIRNQSRARRWQQYGRAVVLHNGPLTAAERDVAALINCGPRSMFTGFTAARMGGLQSWERPWADVLVPAGARVRRVPDVPVRVHYTGSWPPARGRAGRPVEALGPALVRAAGTLGSPRPACGLLAAAVQQRLLRPATLVEAVQSASRVRHRADLLAAAHDITMGAQALSEIDFVRLCRRNALPAPVLQAVRKDRYGRRRYLDAEWRRTRDNRRVVAEVDGALHLITRTWWDDQLRQNELVIADDVVLRFPSVIVRTAEAIVVDQLRRILR